MSDERNEAEPIELGYIEDLGDMISFQEGSTVSRTVMQKAGGNVVLFSFDTGEELSEHTAAMPVFVQTLKGRLKVTGNGRTVELVPGRGAVRHDADDGHAGTRQHRRLKKQDRRHRIPLDSPVPATAGNTRKAPSRELSFCGADNGTRTRGLNLGALPTKLCPHVFHLGGQRIENIQERPPSRKPGVSRFCGAGLAAAPHDGQT